MAKFTMRATGFRASVLLGAVVVIFLLATGSRFRRVCDRIDSYVDEVSTQITAREMRGMVGQIQGKTTDQLIADSSMARRVDALRVTVSGMTCADTFIFGVLCQVSYTLGTGPKGAGDR